MPTPVTDTTNWTPEYLAQVDHLAGMHCITTIVQILAKALIDKRPMPEAELYAKLHAELEHARDRKTTTGYYLDAITVACEMDHSCILEELYEIDMVHGDPGEDPQHESWVYWLQVAQG